MISKARRWDLPEGNLAPLDECDFEVIPHVGFRYTGDGRSIIIAALAITKSGIRFDDRQMSAYGRRLQRLFNGIKGIEDQEYVVERIFAEGDFRLYGSKYAYKFVTQETYDKFIARGSFLVSSLARFRDLEQQGDVAGDRFEGSAHSAFSVADRELTVSTLSGFNFHIFSLARDLHQAAEMKSKFGPVVLRVRLLPFAQALARLLGAPSADIRLIRYADLKMFRGQLSPFDVAGFPPNLTARLAKAIRRNGYLPSIFSKPSRFELEREVRVVVRAATDVAPARVVEDQNILQYVERIDV